MHQIFYESRIHFPVYDSARHFVGCLCHSMLGLDNWEAMGSVGGGLGSGVASIPILA